MTDHNKKLPVDPWSSGVIELKYPWVYGEADNLGGATFKYRNLKEPDKNSSLAINPSGSYQTVQQDSERKEITTALNPGETRSYTGGGASTQTDGHVDDNGESTRRSTTAGDVGQQGGRNFMQGFAENVIKGSKNESSFVMGASESKVYQASKGDIVTDHDGSLHTNLGGDQVFTVKGNVINSVKEGDYSLHIQSGNFDTQVETKGRMFFGDDLLIESATKITLKVGDCAIIIEPDQIYIFGGGIAAQSGDGKDIVIESKNNLGLIAKGDTIAKSDGETEIKASRIDLNP
jgi:hypothetical protein